MRERPIRLGDDGTLLAITCEPAGREHTERPAVLLVNAGLLHRIGPSRLHVRIARELAERGYASIRLDFSGVGDSESGRDGLSFRERCVEEGLAALDHLETRGIDRFLVFGVCSGADAAYDLAVADPRVVGMIPVDGHVYRTWRYHVHHYLPRLVRGESWWNLLTGRTYVGPFLRDLFSQSEEGTGGSEREGQDGIDFRRTPPREEVEEQLRTLLGRDVRMLQLFTAGLEHRYNHQRQFEDAFSSIDFRDLLTVRYFSRANHTVTSLDEQQALSDTVVSWVEEHWPPAPPVPSKDARSRTPESAPPPRRTEQAETSDVAVG